MKVKVENSTFIRDVHSKAILNTNHKELQEYKQKREMLSKVNEINNVKEEIENIKQMMNKILTILSERN